MNEELLTVTVNGLLHNLLIALVHFKCEAMSCEKDVCSFQTCKLQMTYS